MNQKYFFRFPLQFPSRALLFLSLILWNACAAPRSLPELTNRANLAVQSGEWLLAAQLFEKLHRADPGRSEAYYGAGTNFLRANRPAKALAFFSKYYESHRKNQQDLGKIEARMAKAHFMLGNYEAVLAIANSYGYPKMYRGLAREHLKALTRLGRMEPLSSALSFYEQQGIFRDDGKATGLDFLYRAVLNELYLLEQKEELATFARDFWRWSETRPEEDQARVRAYAKFYLGDFAEAIIWIDQTLAKEDTPRHQLDLFMLKGLCQAKLGEEMKARLQMEMLINYGDLPVRHDAFGAAAYQQARIAVALKQYEKALQLLKRSLDEQAEFWSYKFTEDGHLKELFQHPDFQKLVKKK